MAAESDVLHFQFEQQGDVVLQKMNLLRQQNLFCDVSIYINDTEFQGHKVTAPRVMMNPQSGAQAIRFWCGFHLPSLSRRAQCPVILILLLMASTLLFCAFIPDLSSRHVPPKGHVRM